MRTQNIPFSIEKRKLFLNYPIYAAVLSDFSRGLKNEVETSMVL